MIVLGDIPTTRLLVHCEECRRSGSYRLDRLVAKRGRDHSLLAILGEMRARCGREPCLAHLCVPLGLDLDRHPIESNLFTIDTWAGEYQREMRVGAVHNYAVALATFERAVALWPHSIITLSNGAQINRAHRPEEDRAREAQVRIFRRLGLR